tara:strand:- start:449 stop:1231 length:783 start_codon:yes stop_codon:yes gene_type:complete
MGNMLKKPISQVYGDIPYIDNSNNGFDSTIRQLKDGTGGTSALYLSDRNLKVQPSADSTSNSVIYDSDGNALFSVDSTNDVVKAGIGQHTVNTQYAHFGQSHTSTTMVANTHYALCVGEVAYDATYITLGTGTNPDTSKTISALAQNLVGKFWYVPDNITIDRVIWFSGADTATGDTTRAHLMSYDIDTGNGSTGGDLSNGTVLADGSDIINAGYEQTYYQQMTIQSANVNAGKAIFFVFRSDSINSDYTVKATIKYHLR